MVKFIVEADYFIRNYDDENEVEISDYRIIVLGNRVGEFLAAEEEFSNFREEWVEYLNTMHPDNETEYRIVFEVQITYSEDYWGEVDGEVILKRKWNGVNLILEDREPDPDKAVFKLA